MNSSDTNSNAIQSLHPVVQRVLSRRDLTPETSREQFADGRRIGLVIEGGAMRGIVSAGMLVGLEQLGLTNVFDRVYGTSAGAINACFFLAGQARFGTTIYYQNINNRHFIDYLRLSRIVDIDYLIDEVMVYQKPLNVARVLASRSALKIVATNAATGAPKAFDKHDGTADLLTYLRASAAMPILYNRKVQIGDANFVDGGVSNSIPLADALNDGCTDVLVLLTRRKGEFPNGNKLLGYLSRRLLTKHFGLALARAYSERPIQYKATQERIESISNDSRSAVQVLVIRPSESDFVASRVEKDRNKLIMAATGGLRNTLETFGVTNFMMYEGLSVDY